MIFPAGWPTVLPTQPTRRSPASIPTTMALVETAAPRTVAEPGTRTTAPRISSAPSRLRDTPSSSMRWETLLLAAAPTPPSSADALPWMDANADGYEPWAWGPYGCGNPACSATGTALLPQPTAPACKRTSKVCLRQISCALRMSSNAVKTPALPESAAPPQGYRRPAGRETRCLFGTPSNRKGLPFRQS